MTFRRAAGLLGIALMLSLLLAPRLQAHALQPGYLDISPYGNGTWRVVWRVPNVNGAPMRIAARLPDGCTPQLPPDPAFDGAGWKVEWIATCAAPLQGGTLSIEGLDRTRTDVLVRFETPDGSDQSFRLTPDSTQITIPTEPGPFVVIASYVPLGIDHILEGTDHLLFVFALLLLIADGWRLVSAITAFTVAHSITMAAATLNLLDLPGPPVEAVIALSIVFLASELLHRQQGTERLSQRYPWAVSFSFGLLHGFGFAGALREIGVPQGDVPLALLSFNLGVEIGQLVFVGSVLLVGLALRRIVPAAVHSLRTPGSPLATVSAYAIGGTSAYWVIDRLAGF